MFWEDVLWTDETKIEFFGHNYRNHVWRKDVETYLPKNRMPTVKFGGGRIMIYGCFSAKCVGKISVIDDGMNAKSYQKILHDNSMTFVEMLRLPHYCFFQQDDNLEHFARSTKNASLKVILMSCICKVSPKTRSQMRIYDDIWKFKSGIESQEISRI